MSVYMCVHISAHANKKWVPGLRRWSYKAIVSHLTWVLGTEFSSSASIVHAFNHGVTSQALSLLKSFYLNYSYYYYSYYCIYIYMYACQLPLLYSPDLPA